MMVSTLVFLLAPLMLLLAAGGSNAKRSSATTTTVTTGTTSTTGTTGTTSTTSTTSDTTSSTTSTTSPTTSTTTSYYKFKRLNKSEEEARADRLYPRWKSGCVSTWELSNHYEADLLLRNRDQLKMAIRDVNMKWPTRRIPYRISDGYFKKAEKKKIRAAIEEFNKFTCVKFRKSTKDDDDYIDIRGEYDGCASYVGKQGGEQLLNLEPRLCLRRRGNIYHVLMHALGFAHEHNSPARDHYVYVNEGMVAKDKKEWVKKYPLEMIRDYGYGYDFESIMHGSRTFASANKSITIEPFDPNVRIGNKNVLSKIDIAKVNYHFGCMQRPDH